MTDNPQAESVSKPTNSIQETQEAFANLINTARSEQPKPEVKETVSETKAETKSSLTFGE